MSVTLNGKENIASRKATRLLLSFLILLLVLGVSFLSQLGVILLPLLVGALASLFVIEKGSRRILSIGMSVIAVSIDLIFNGYVSFNCLLALLLALLISRQYMVSGSKGTCVVICTLTVSFFLVGYVLLSAFDSVRSFNFDLATEHIKNTVELTKETVYNLMASMTTKNSEGQLVRLFTDEIINTTLDAYLTLMPSVFAIVALAVVGFSYKSFGLIFDKILHKGRLSLGSTLRAPSSLAYFYFVLMILQLFESDGSLLMTALTNLHAVLMLLFAYFGFRFAHFFLSHRLRSPFLAGVVLLIVTLIFSGFAIQILSVVGTIEAVTYARIMARSDNENNDSGG